jgi:hypothetical protein
MPNSVIGFDMTAIRRARELQGETRALRRQTRALIRDIHANHSVICGISEPMLMEIAYDLTAFGYHDLSRLCRAASKGIAMEL